MTGLLHILIVTARLLILYYLPVVRVIYTDVFSTRWVVCSHAAEMVSDLLRQVPMW